MDAPTLNAGSLISLLPAVVFFLIFQRTLTRGITTGAGKCPIPTAAPGSTAESDEHEVHRWLLAGPAGDASDAPGPGLRHLGRRRHDDRLRADLAHQDASRHAQPTGRDGDLQLARGYRGYLVRPRRALRPRAAQPGCRRAGGRPGRTVRCLREVRPGR